MNLKKGTPGDGGQVRAEQFGYTPTAVGLKGGWAAWCAHEPYWCQAHEHNDRERGTKVCLHWATDGALRCPRCRAANPPTWIAYVPVWREIDLAPCMVICHRSVEDLLRPLRFGVFVLVGRVESQCSVYVREQEKQRPWISTHPERQGPCNLAHSLLTMWAYPQYDQWLKEQNNRAKQETNEARGVETPARLRLSVPPPTSEVEALAIDAERKSDTGGSVWVDEVLNRVKHRSKNGRHET